METSVKSTVCFGEFALDPVRRVLDKDGEAVRLNSKTLDLLLVLIENHGQIVSKNDLLDKVWEGQFVEENNLSVHVTALRKALGERKNENQFIVTVPGKGYKFIAELKDGQETELVIEDHTFERIVVNEEIEEIPAQSLLLPGKKSRLIPATIVIAIVLVAGGIGAWFLLGGFAAKDGPIESIAVMPFVYEGGNAENEYLSDGITESLISDLSQLPNLTVKARNSVYHYKGKQVEPLKVGRELSVQALLLGRIAERGDSVVFSVELVQADTNNHLWGAQYTRKLSDLSAVQSEISRDVSAKLQKKLTDGTAPGKGHTANAEAYQLYLKGRYVWNKRKHDEHVKAIAFFEQAIELDPNFALAYAGLGDVYTVESFKASQEEKDRKGREAGLKALSLAPGLAEAHTILAKTEWNALNWAESEKHFKLAIESNPNYASARQWYAENLLRRAKIDEAIAEINRAIELDPLSLVINADAAYIYLIARQYDRAIAQANKTLELDSNWRTAYTWRGFANEEKGEFELALDDFEKTAEVAGSAEKKEIALGELRQIREAFRKSGAAGYWQKMLEIELARPEAERDPYLLGIIYTKTNQKEKALSALERAVDERNRNVDLLKVETYLEPIRSEPRYQALLRRLNLN